MGELTDNDCVNLMATGDALFALTETDRITQIDKETLKTKDRVSAFNDVQIHLLILGGSFQQGGGKL